MCAMRWSRLTAQKPNTFDYKEVLSQFAAGAVALDSESNCSQRCAGCGKTKSFDDSDAKDTLIATQKYPTYSIAVNVA